MREVECKHFRLRVLCILASSECTHFLAGPVHVGSPSSNGARRCARSSSNGTAPASATPNALPLAPRLPHGTSRFYRRPLRGDRGCAQYLGTSQAPTSPRAEGDGSRTPVTAAGGCSEPGSRRSPRRRRDSNAKELHVSYLRF